MIEQFIQSDYFKIILIGICSGIFFKGLIEGIASATADEIEKRNKDKK